MSATEALCACALAAAAAVEVPGGDRVRAGRRTKAEGVAGASMGSSPAPRRPDGVRGVGCECEYQRPGGAEAYRNPRDLVVCHCREAVGGAEAASLCA